MKTIYCFCCNGIRPEKGAVAKDWGFGPRHFCGACAPRVAEMPDREDRASTWLNQKAPGRVEIASPIPTTRPPAPAGQRTTSMAQWVRERAALPMEDLCRKLVEAFPTSKPGLNPKLAKSYINCYLKKAG